MEIEACDHKTVAHAMQDIADEILEISARLNDCGEAVTCRECSSKLISAASRCRLAAGKLKALPGDKKETQAP